MTNLPGPAGPAARPPMPVDIGTARELWWGVVGFGVVQLIATMVTAVQERATFTKQIYDELHASDPKLTMETAELMVVVAFAFAAVLALGIAGLVLLFVHQLGRGRLWARTVLTIIGVWLVLTAMGTLFTLGTATGVASPVAGGAAIVQGVLAGGAVYLSHRPDSTAYFLMNRR